MPQFPLQTEKAHTAEFILSEANGHQSRDNGFLAHPITVRVGQPLQRTAAATTDKPATYVVAATGAACEALAIYGGTSIDTTNGLRIAVLSNNAEVNLRLIDWGSLSTAEQATGVTTLAGKGIKCRI